MNPLGVMVLVDAYKCDATKMNDVSYMEAFLKEAIKVLGVTATHEPLVINVPHKEPDPKGTGGGLSGWIPLIESGIQAHAYDAFRFFSVDYYTCSEVTPEIKQNLINLVKDWYKPEHFEVKTIDRGAQYYD